MKEMIRVFRLLLLAIAAPYFLIAGAFGAITHELLSIAGKVEVSHVGSDTWETAIVGQKLTAGDRIRTGPNSRAQVRLSTRAILPVAELSVITLGGDEAAPDSAAFDLQIGRAFFLGNDKPGKVRFRTRSVAGAVRGTEFHLEAAEDGTTTLLLFDGAVELSNPAGALALHSGQAAIVETNSAPKLRPMLATRRSVQWYLYYPIIVAPSELPEANEAYAQGNVLEAAREPGTNALLNAAIALSVGQAAKAERLLAGNPSELAEAIRLLISVVADTTNAIPPRAWSTASGWLAESYRAQAQFDLTGALAAAAKATSIAPNFGAAWIRLAALQFGFGRSGVAREAVARGLSLSPMNAQGWAVQGFLQAAERDYADATKSFDRAIALDGSVPDAWLGRGLLAMRSGETELGYADLQTAAALDPERAINRSYLAKALDVLDEPAAVEQELERAMRLDPNDPTAWLYAALIHHRQNQVNRAIRELEDARARNNNRALFRSRQLLDEDRATTAANLALIYQDAGMFEVARREASAAVQSDYASHAAHLFLANSYAQLQDPRRATLRYETATVSEYLLANLLSPAGAGAFSPRISENEYTRLFARNRFGLVSETEYESSGTWRQGAAQYGIFDGTSYAIEQIYRSEAAPHPNGDLEQTSFSALFKQQLTPKDLLYVQAIYDSVETGDARQLLSPNDSLTSVRTMDEQLPFLLAGYNHEWRPGVNTLVLGSFVRDDYQVALTNQSLAAFGTSADGTITRVPRTQPLAPWDYQDRQNLYSIEAQQIVEAGRNTLVAGLRYQTADHDTSSELGRSSLFQFQTAVGTFPGTFRANGNAQSISEDFERYAGYLYDTYEIFDRLFLTAGLSYDTLNFPQNFRSPPLTNGSEDTDRLSPKAGLLWRPAEKTLLRAAYSQSLGGASFDQSIRIEPTQIAGVNQTFRSVMPESLVGAITAARFESVAASVDQKIGRNLYLGLEGEWIQSEAGRTLGAIDFQTAFPFAQSAGEVKEILDYRERSLLGTVHYLWGEYIALGARHRVSDAELESVIPQISAPFNSRVTSEALLNQTDLFIIANHPSGFFSEFDGTAYVQSIESGNNESFWQFDVTLGWRSPRRRIETAVSLLNLTDQDYRLYPLNAYRDPPRERTFAARLRLNF